MAEFPVARANANLAQLVRQAEAGQELRITRRRKPVAVLMSVARYEHLTARQTTLQDSLFDFTTRMRLEAAATGLPLFEAEHWHGVSDHGERPAQVELLVLVPPV
jgi:prevent-host-death family protein